jgi:hypothetical protein
MEINAKNSSFNFSGLREDGIQILTLLFPFKAIDFQASLKYLGFILKPNNYGSEVAIPQKSRCESQTRGNSNSRDYE